MKADKVLIAENNVAGGLYDLEQIYTINFLKKDNNHSDKIELAIKLKKNGEDKYAYRSLRFSSLTQLKRFIFDLTNAYFYFLQQKTEMKDPQTKSHIMMDFLKELKDNQINAFKNSSEIQVNK